MVSARVFIQITTGCQASRPAIGVRAIRLLKPEAGRPRPRAVSQFQRNHVTGPSHPKCEPARTTWRASRRLRAFRIFYGMSREIRQPYSRRIIGNFRDTNLRNVVRRVHDGRMTAPRLSSADSLYGVPDGAPLIRSITIRTCQRSHVLTPCRQLALKCRLRQIDRSGRTAILVSQGHTGTTPRHGGIQKW